MNETDSDSINISEKTTEETNLDFDHYCNYPEISKPINRLGFSRHSSIEETDTFSSNEFSSLSKYSLFSDSVPSVAERDYSASNVKLLPSSRTNTKSSDGSSDIESFSTFIQEVRESSVPVSLEEEHYEKHETNVEYWDVSGPFFDQLNDPTGWKKYSTVPDPWNTEGEVFNKITDYDAFELSEEELSGMLTERIVASGSSKLGQLPDTKNFALTKLCLSRKQLKDISILLKYRYFQYIDLSWNMLTNLKALSTLNYLMWLDVSHNQIKDIVDVNPPWFLTYLNLSCNEIKEISDLSGLWSLRHLDLSWNLIEKIQNLDQLKYMRHLNLAHNHITVLEGLDYLAVEKLLLNNNRICEFDSNPDYGLSTMENLAYLNLANNKISSLRLFLNTYKLKTVDLRNNCIRELLDLDYLDRCIDVENIILHGNEIVKWPTYREFTIYKFPKLLCLDGLKVTSEEQVAAQIAFSSDIFISAYQRRAKITLVDQLYTRRITADTLPYDQSLVPFVLLVGPPASGKKFMGRYLADKFPKYIHWCTIYSTQPTPTLDMADEFWKKQKRVLSTTGHAKSDLILITLDVFNEMTTAGKFLLVTELFGYKYGLCKDELAKCIMEDKICLTEMCLEDALSIKSHCLFPRLILLITDSVQLHTNRLRDMYNNIKFMAAERQQKITLASQGKSDDESLNADTDKATSNGRRPLTGCSSGITAVDIKLNIEQKFTDCPESVACNKLYSQTEIPSRNIRAATNTDSNTNNLECVSSKGVHRQERYSVVTFSPVVEGFAASTDSENSEKNRYWKTHRYSASDVLVNASDTAESYKFNEENYVTEEKSTMFSSIDSVDSRLHDYCCRLNGEDSLWSWYLTPSTEETLEPEIDEMELAIEEARKTFVRDGLNRAEKYLSIHNENPGLFYDTVVTDDLDKACAKASAILQMIYNERMTFVSPFKIKDDPFYNCIVGDRISCLMKEIFPKKSSCF